MNDRRSTARERALRAARVVTLSASIAGMLGTSACSERASVGDSGAGSDASSMLADSGSATDGGSSPLDSGVATDARVTSDARVTTDSGMAVSDSGAIDSGIGIADAQVTDGGDGGCTAFVPDTEACCIEMGGFWSEGSCAIAVPGPFVPPSIAA